MRISDWSSDVCSSDLQEGDFVLGDRGQRRENRLRHVLHGEETRQHRREEDPKEQQARRLAGLPYCLKQRATAEFLIDEKTDRDRKGECQGRRFRRRREAAKEATEDQKRQQGDDPSTPAV